MNLLRRLRVKLADGKTHKFEIDKIQFSITDRSLETIRKEKNEKYMKSCFKSSLRSHLIVSIPIKQVFTVFDRRSEEEKKMWEGILRKGGITPLSYPPVKTPDGTSIVSPAYQLMLEIGEIKPEVYKKYYSLYFEKFKEEILKLLREYEKDVYGKVAIK